MQSGHREAATPLRPLLLCTRESSDLHLRDGMLPQSRCHLQEDEECGLLGVFTQFSVSSRGSIPPRASNYSLFPGTKGFPRTGEFSGKLNSRKSQENRMS